MKLKLYQIDAFAEQAFQGNPAAVVPLQQWLPDAAMQKIALENNLSETAFFVPDDDGYHIRWFTPEVEVRLCGHATLASAYVLFNCLGFQGETLRFHSLSGDLFVRQQGKLLVMDFPADPPQPCEAPAGLLQGLGAEAVEYLAAKDYLAVFASAEDVLQLKPDFIALAGLDLRGVIATAPGDDVDFVVRFFAPAKGIPEDPVTGSAYTQLAPYWTARLDKPQLRARQVSKRSGEVSCVLDGERVQIAGSAVKFLEGEIDVDVLANEDIDT